ncbi:hypothetical protein UA08_04988 [Talaromyces atroroseus]|uniref:O-methyltransferase domain-containing protein n=1 Tax=Talaromyces atroroseus TaxID=1441469 RepID=A0A225AMH6_TALAT|nr:hypothetical protein UA08_04988 [Talaromyces atroroseus]OKL59534.1 hypothetical protein UA08_04988 [Talaromyces atroroseus]
MPSPLTHLAEQLLESAKALDAYNEVNGLEPASFETESFTDLPVAVEAQRKKTIDLAQDLKRLAQGPRDLLFESLNLVPASIWFVVCHVPASGDISYTELATLLGFDEILLRRMLRVAMMNRLFIETPSGDHVRHSAASRILHQERAAMDTCGFFLEEMFPAATRMVETMKKYPASGEPNETAFNVAFNTSRPFYLELEAYPERARRFGAAMRWMSRGGRFSNDHLIRGYDWAQFDHEGGLMVDVGGGHGTVSVALANFTSNMRFIVQDLPTTASQGADSLPVDLKNRVSFMPHDFFAPQPVVGADVYFFRYILHNWSDKYAERILKGLVPSLKDGARIVCYEFLPGNSSTTAWSEKQPYFVVGNTVLPPRKLNHQSRTLLQPQMDNIPSIDTHSGLHLPRLLFLHGGGTSARIFRRQCRTLTRALSPFFRVVFADAPFRSEPEPAIIPVYGRYGSFRRWLRWSPEHAPINGPDAVAAIQDSLCEAMAEDDLAGGTGAWVGLVGFSQGGKIAGSVLYETQMRAAQGRAGFAGGSWKFAVMLAARAPLVALSELTYDQDTFDLPGSILSPPDVGELSRNKHRLTMPTVHVHGLQDPGLRFHRILLNDFTTLRSAEVVEWDGDHRVPAKSTDVAGVVQATLRAAKKADIPQFRWY